MSVRKQSAPLKRRRTGKPLATSSEASKLDHKNTTSEQLPDLTAVYDAFIDAHALIHTACKVMEKCDDDEDIEPAKSVLSQGVKALDAVADRLEGAEMQLNRFRHKNPTSGRRADMKTRSSS